MNCIDCLHYRSAESEPNFCAVHKVPPPAFPHCGPDNCPDCSYDPGSDDDLLTIDDAVFGGGS